MLVDALCHKKLPHPICPLARLGFIDFRSCKIEPCAVRMRSSPTARLNVGLKPNLQNQRLRKNRTHGFTLIELLVSIVVLGIALTSLSVGLFNASRGSADPVVAMRAAELGQAYLEEILAKRFDENTDAGGVVRCNEPTQPVCSATLGSDAGETRASFDDVDDYQGVTDNPPVDAMGAVRPLYSDYRVTISVSYADAEIGLVAGSEDAKRIEVSVYSPLNDVFVFSAYRGNF